MLLILLAIVAILLIWLIAIQWRLSRIRQVFNGLTEGLEDANLEEALYHYIDAVEKNTQLTEDLIALTENLRMSARNNIQRVGLIRFNPFEDAGGDQSFAIALLDAEGTGLVLSSLFSRTGSRMFAKEVVAGRSSHVLTDEEVEAINMAMSTDSG